VQGVGGEDKRCAVGTRGRVEEEEEKVVRRYTRWIHPSPFAALGIVHNPEATTTQYSMYDETL